MDTRRKKRCQEVTRFCICVRDGICLNSLHWFARERVCSHFVMPISPFQRWTALHWESLHTWVDSLSHYYAAHWSVWGALFFSCSLCHRVPQSFYASASSKARNPLSLPLGAYATSLYQIIFTFFSVLELLFKRSIDDYPFYVFILPSFSSRMVFLFSCLPWIVTPSYTHTHTHARSSPPSLPELVTLPGGQFGIGPNFNNALPPLYLCVWQLGRKKFQKEYKKE